jgi:hypothetical protein
MHDAIALQDRDSGARNGALGHRHPHHGIESICRRTSGLSRHRRQSHRNEHQGDEEKAQCVLRNSFRPAGPNIHGGSDGF